VIDATHPAEERKGQLEEVRRNGEDVDVRAAECFITNNNTYIHAWIITVLLY
jgi:hypothetical protein